MFPHYTSDPAIAGAPGAEISDSTPDVEAFVQKFARREEDTGERDDLDDLIDALDKLDG